MTIRSLLADHGLRLKGSGSKVRGCKRYGVDELEVVVLFMNKQKVVNFTISGNGDWSKYFRKEAKILSEKIKTEFNHQVNIIERSN